MMREISWREAYPAMHARPYDELSSYKVCMPSDKLDWIRACLNQHGGVSDDRYNKIIIYLLDGSEYTDDIESNVSSLVKLSDEEFEACWQDCLKRRKNRAFTRAAI